MTVRANDQGHARTDSVLKTEAAFRKATPSARESSGFD